MNTPRCNNCNDFAHKKLIVQASNTYALCFVCAVNLSKTKSNQIGAFLVSQRTCSIFSEQVKSIIEEIYDAGTVFNESIGNCPRCQKKICQGTFDPDRLIYKISKHSCTCRECIKFFY